MAQLKPQKPIKIVTSTPALVVDGHGIGVDPASGNASLSFFQLLANQEMNAEQLEADIVANVRLSNEQLRGLHESLGEAIKEFDSQKSAKDSKTE